MQISACMNYTTKHTLGENVSHNSMNLTWQFISIAVMQKM